MQKQTFKLQNHMALVFAALTLAMPQSGASCWSFMGKIGAGINFLGIRKQKWSGLKFPTYENGNLKSFADAGEVETEALNNQVMDVSAAISAIYKFSEVCGVGPVLEVGYAFTKEQCKSWKSLTLREGLFAKVGLAVSITDWVMLSVGVRFSQLTADISFSEFEKIELNAAKNAAGILSNTANIALAGAAAGTPPGTGVSAAGGTFTGANGALFEAQNNVTAAAQQSTYVPSIGDYQFDSSKSYSDSQNVWGGYADFSVLFPVTENVKLVVTLGVFADWSSPEFNLGKIKQCTTAPITDNAKLAAAVATAPGVVTAAAAAVAPAAGGVAAGSANAAAVAAAAAAGGAGAAAAATALTAAINADAGVIDAQIAATAAAAAATWDDGSTEVKAKNENRAVVKLGIALAYSW